MPGGRLRLASRSPRRAALLEAAGIAFDPGPYPDVDETLPEGLDPPAAARALAERKAQAVLGHVGDAAVLTADTLVFLGREVLGKPADAADARRMLARLSGRRHAVATGVAVGRRDAGLHSAVDVAEVTFRHLEAPEIQAYVATGEGLDKAGAYAIQGEAAAFVRRLQGDWETVVGLPTALVRRLLERQGRSGR